MENLEKDKQPQDPHRPSQKALAMMLLEAGIEFALLIGVPLIAFIYFGKKLDTRFHTKFIVLIGIFLAIAVSSMAIWTRIKEYKKLMKND